MLVAVLVVIGLSGCATKKHVRLQVDPLNQRIGQLETKSKQTDTSIADLERGVSKADERAQSAESKAAQASKEALAAMQRAEKSGDEARSAADSAAGAKSLAEKGIARAGEVENRLLNSLSNIDNYQLIATESVLFAFAQSKLTDDAKQQLDGAVGRIREHKHYVLEVQGFTDRVGQADYNLELSRRRANEVVRYLTVNHKIPLHRIYVVGLGSVMPVADDKTSAGRKQNRRVEVRLYSADEALSGKKVTASTGGGL
jgi:outer membrane protein OmpA-like peptidoglycan-associated protein